MQPLPDSAKNGQGGRLTATTVFVVGFGLSTVFLYLEYLTAGRFLGWLLLIPTNPLLLIAALIGHQLENVVQPRWADETFFGTILLESALWWYAIAFLIVARRHRRPDMAARK